MQLYSPCHAPNYARSDHVPLRSLVIIQLTLAKPGENQNVPKLSRLAPPEPAICLKPRFFLFLTPQNTGCLGRVSVSKSHETLRDMDFVFARHADETHLFQSKSTKITFWGQNRPKPFFSVKTTFFDQHQPNPIFWSTPTNITFFGQN